MAFAKEDKLGMVALIGGAEVSLSLDVRYQYEVTHLGKDASGNDDANSALSAWVSTRANTTMADSSVQDQKFELPDSASECFGPGIENLYFVSAANADAVLGVVRVGTPTNSY